MTVIVLDMQSVLYARLLERAMLQELDNHQIIISKTPNLTKDICEIHKPRVVIMEVTGYSPWMLNDRLELSNQIKKNNPGCRQKARRADSQSKTIRIRRLNTIYIGK